MLAHVLARPTPGLRLNEHLDEEDGQLLFEHARRKYSSAAAGESDTISSSFKRYRIKTAPRTLVQQSDRSAVPLVPWSPQQGGTPRR